MLNFQKTSHLITDKKNVVLQKSNYIFEGGPGGGYYKQEAQH